MKARLFILLFSVLAALSVRGQDVAPQRRAAPAAPDTAAADTLLALPLAAEPAFLLRAPGFEGMSPFAAGLDGCGWQLHAGFNAALSLNVTAGFGSHAPRGAGFGQDLAFAYAFPLTQRLSAAAGLCATHFNWGPFRWTGGGLAAALAYRLTDDVSLYAYGAKSFLPRKGFGLHGPLPLFLHPDGDRIGAMIDFKVGRNASIQVSVERGNGTDYR